ncbi:hypothetical protein [[Acholeplasma] multilocale]|uniref:hypothetical protein n=1 Tax=[Acholeplasma] multilocale TaxID=264638 RepID=UPI00047EC490|nr:hypothetical protein [[Acholeplasma] multilocale]
MSFKEKLESYKNLNDGTVASILAREFHNQLLNDEFLSIEETSKKTNVSTSAITKFAQRFGFSGFKELSKRLKLISTDFNQFQPNESIERLDQLAINLRDIIAEFDKKYRKMLLEISQIVMDSKGRIYIVHSQVLSQQAQFVYDLLLMAKAEVYMNNNNVFSYPLYNTIQEDDIVIMLVAGHGNETLYLTYELVKPITNNIFIATTISHMDKFAEEKYVISTDSNEVSANIIYRKLIWDYLIAQIYTILYEIK